MPTRETFTKGDGKGGEITITKWRCEGCDNLHDTEAAAIQCEKDCAEEIAEAQSIDVEPHIQKPRDVAFPQCEGCIRSSHGAHCAWPFIGKCKDGSAKETRVVKSKAALGAVETHSRYVKEAVKGYLDAGIRMTQMEKEIEMLKQEIVFLRGYLKLPIGP